MLTGMKKLGWIGVIAGVLLLSGCAAPGGQTTEVEPSAAVETAAPLAVDEAPAEAADLSDAQFLEEVRLRAKTITEASDEQLIAAGHAACDAYAAGTTRAEMQLVEGEEPDEDGMYWDSIAIAAWGAKVYCPEFDS